MSLNDEALAIADAGESKTLALENVLVVECFGGPVYPVLTRVASRRQAEEGPALLLPKFARRSSGILLKRLPD